MRLCVLNLGVDYNYNKFRRYNYNNYIFFMIFYVC